MYIAKREGQAGSILYFKEDTRWSSDKSEAKLFQTKSEAIRESDFTGLYEVTVEEV